MAEYQKFMFDNFVIECDDNKCIAEPFEVSEDEYSVVENEVTELESNNVEIIEEYSEPIEEDSSEATIEETTLPPSYSQEELDKAIANAEEKALAKGKEIAIEESEQRKQLLFSEIESNLRMLIEKQDEYLQSLEKTVIELAVVAIEKILPSLEQDVAKKEVEAFLDDNFIKFRRENNLSFTFSPDMVAEIAPILSKLANKNDYEGKIAVHKDINLGLTDCRVEWKNGGVERSSAKIKDKIKDLIQK